MALRAVLAAVCVASAAGAGGAVEGMREPPLAAVHASGVESATNATSTVVEGTTGAGVDTDAVDVDAEADVGGGLAGHASGIQISEEEPEGAAIAGFETDGAAAKKKTQIDESDESKGFLANPVPFLVGCGLCLALVACGNVVYWTWKRRRAQADGSNALKKKKKTASGEKRRLRKKGSAGSGKYYGSMSDGGGTGGYESASDASSSAAGIAKTRKTSSAVSDASGFTLCDLPPSRTMSVFVDVEGLSQASTQGLPHHPGRRLHSPTDALARHSSGGAASGSSSAFRSSGNFRRYAAGQQVQAYTIGGGVPPPAPKQQPQPAGQTGLAGIKDIKHVVSEGELDRAAMPKPPRPVDERSDPALQQRLKVLSRQPPSHHRSVSADSAAGGLFERTGSSGSSGTTETGSMATAVDGSQHAQAARGAGSGNSSAGNVSTAAAAASPHGNGHGSRSGYTVIRTLGMGTFGVVYEVERKRTQKRYALKRIACANERARRAAFAEFRFLSTIRHPHLMRAHDVFAETSGDVVAAAMGTQRDGRGRGEESKARLNDPSVTHLCLILDYYPAGDLKRLIKDRPAALTYDVVLRFTGQIASVLHALHSRSPPITHRDLKPENVLVQDGLVGVVVTDLGHAAAVAAGGLTAQAGTVPYVAPEVLEGDYTARADLWSLGCIVYAMVTHRVSASDVRVMWRDSAAAALPSFHAAIANDLRDAGCSQEVAAIALGLLHPDPAVRMSAWAVEKAAAAAAATRDNSAAAPPAASPAGAPAFTVVS